MAMAVARSRARTGDSTVILVILESPYASSTKAGVRENERFARACMRDCLKRGEAPYASHLLYTQPGVLDDKDPDERALGIEAGLLWGKHATKTVVYLDRGTTGGMQQGMRRAELDGREIEWRWLDPEQAIRMGHYRKVPIPIGAQVEWSTSVTNGAAAYGNTYRARVCAHRTRPKAAHEPDGLAPNVVLTDIRRRKPNGKNWIKIAESGVTRDASHVIIVPEADRKW
jgi:hypothetical protein